MAVCCFRFEPSDCGKLGEFQCVLVLHCFKTDGGDGKLLKHKHWGYWILFHQVSDIRQSVQLTADMMDVSSLEK